MQKTTTVLFLVGLLMTILSMGQAPVITSFSPASGPAGTFVTVQGANFNTTPRRNIVYFGATRARTVVSQTATGFAVLIPPGASYQPMSVLDTMTSLTGYASQPFVVAFRPGSTQIFDSNSFQAKVDFATGTKPESVAIGDLDSDGKPDLVVANSNSNTVSVYRNLSSAGTINGASFAPKIDFTVGLTPLAVAIGDLDGNGRPEIVVVNYNQSSVSVLPNFSWAGTISFGARVNFAAGSIPFSIAIGDLDRDGRPDLAITNIYDNTVSVLRNTTVWGNISFAARVTYATGTVPFSIAIGDLDGDAKPEMAVANNTSGTVSVFRNTASSGSITPASFAPKVDFAADASHFVAIGDLDLDGKPDLALSGNSRISVLRNTASSGSITPASFAAKVDFTTGAGPYGVAITDLNGDGKPDLAAVNSNSNTVSVLRNTSSPGNITAGSFSSKVDFSIGNSPFSLAIGDLDLDGKPDLVTANYASNTISVLRNALSAGPPAPPANLTATAGIGQVTLRWTANTEGNIRYYTVYGGTTPHPTDTLENVSHPTVSHTETGLSNGTRYYFRITAVDNLGYESVWTEDVMVTTGSLPPVITSFTPVSGPVQTSVVINGTNFNPTYGNNIVYFGATEARVTAGSANQLTVRVDPGATHQPISVTDTITSLTAYAAKPFGVTFGTGAGKLIDSNSFGSKVDLAASSQPYSVAIGDLDSDGKSDLVVVNDTSRTVSVYRNISSAGTITAASFAAKVDFATGDSPFAVAIGDLDGDARLDLVVANFSNRTVSVFKNTTISITGIITFAARVDFATGEHPSSVAIGDLDRDGKPELVVTNLNDRTVSILRNVISNRRITTTSFEPAVNFTTGIAPRSVAIGDLNGDGRRDLVVANNASNTVSVFNNVTVDDSLAFYSRDLATATTPVSVVIGDLDGDGKPDLAVANVGSDTVSVLRNTTLSGGTPSFAAKVGFATGLRPVLIAIGNLNGDAKPDLVTANLDSNTLSVFRNTASAGSITTSSFAPRVDVAVERMPFSVAIGDLDNDGKPELVSANYSNTISILHNNLDVTPPAMPTGLIAGSGNSQILLNWNANTESDLVYYKVYRGTKAYPSTLLVTVPAPTTTLLDYGVNGTKYYYRISAVDSAGNESAKTADVTATPTDEKSEFRKKNTTEQEERYTEEITLHPNPSKGPVQLALPTADHAVIAVLDIRGRIIKQGEYNSATVALDLGNVPKGVYLISIQQKALVRTLRVVIH